jgi:hypothetical protein
MRHNIACGKEQNKDSREKSTVHISKNALKLAAALELRSEGYSRISFDKPIESCLGKVYIHVLGEDALGFRMAIYCINKAQELNPNRVLDIVTEIQQDIGDDGDVVIAIPINLLDKAKEIFGFTPRVFLIDYEMRVWVHSRASGVTQMFKQNWLGTNGLEVSDEIEGQRKQIHVAKYDVGYIV